MRRIISIFLMMLTILVSFFGCGAEDETSGSTSYVSDTNPAAETPNILTIGYSSFSGQFSPFYAETETDFDVVRLTSVNLMSFDRSGQVVESAIDGETVSHNGTDYNYSGISDMHINIDDDGTVEFDFQLRDDIKFSDGEILNADDVIFTMYVLSDPSYDGQLMFNTLPIYGINEYINSDAESISGIIKTGEFSFRICMNSYDSSSISLLSIAVAPMHYYGDATLYDYDNNSFGFVKGDLSGIKVKSGDPLGAGAYKFQKYENGTVYLERNKHYYKGEPNIPFLELREVRDEATISGIADGELDLANINYNKKAVDDIVAINGGTDSGEVLKSYISENLGFGYIGISADNVNVNGEKDSEASKNLRKAFATLFSVYRESAVEEYYGSVASVIEYPISNSFWAAPNIGENNYKTAYCFDVNDNEIYRDDMTESEKYEAALEAAKGYLIAAGYAFDSKTQKFTSAPKGASLSYEVLIPADGIGDHAVYSIFTKAKEALSKVGITLVIKDIETADEFWNILDSGDYQIWAAVWNTTGDSALYQIFHSANMIGVNGSTDSNYYGIADESLDSLIMLERSADNVEYRKDIYYECFDIISDWGVIVPVYQRKNALIVNAHTVNTNSLDTYYTEFYNWIDDVHLFEMNEVYN